MDNTRDLVNRIEQLETQDRRTKRAFRGVLAVGAVALAMSMAAPRVCKTVWGERFVLKDGSMRERMVLDAYGTKHPTLTFKDKEGGRVAELQVGAEGEMSMKVFRDGKPTNAFFELVAEDDESSSVR
ncbi:MAG: hypothetical protein ACI835_002552 [Planctomycetota bacterium]|jgi:hypothetical protein